LKLGITANITFGITIGISGLSGSAASVAGQFVTNLSLGKDPGEGLVFAAISGGIIGVITGAVSHWLRQWLASKIQAIDPPTNRAGLRQAMGQPPPGMRNPQGHHNFPWKLRDWFAAPRRGINVNAADYGRWVEGTPPGPHQVWHAEYSAAWNTFAESYSNADRWQVLAFLKYLLSTGKFPSQ
jgi:hypothetical protein